MSDKRTYCIYCGDDGDAFCEYGYCEKCCKEEWHYLCEWDGVPVHESTEPSKRYIETWRE